MKIRKSISALLVSNIAPVVSFILALLVAVVMLYIQGVNPVVAFQALWSGAFGGVNSLADTVVKFTPLVMVGVGICVAFRGGVYNIGGEGQLIIGALFSTFVILYFPTWPGWILIIMSFLAGFLGGAIWGAIAGVLKGYCKVNEVLGTIMLNYIAVYLMNYLLRGPIIDPVEVQFGSYIPQTVRFPFCCDLPRLVPTRLHLGAGLAVLFAILVYIFLWKTTIGFRIRLAGSNPRAAHGAGVNVPRYIILALMVSGAMAGAAGTIEIIGVHHRMFTDGSATGFTGMAGYNGIVAALFGRLNPIGTIPASFLFGALLTGANKMQRAVQVPAALIGAMNGLIVIFVVGSEILRQRYLRRLEVKEEMDSDSKKQETRNE